MTTLAAFLNDISFFEVGMSLILLGVIEQIYIRLPEDLGGPSAAK